MSGRKSRTKGRRGEYEVVDLFRKLGFAARRVPLSGASEGFPGDVEVPGMFEKSIEVKRGQHVPAVLYKWLEDRPAVMMRRDNEGWLIALRFDEFVRVLDRVNKFRLIRR